jgi:hypothetical protein|tara:strand:- start:1428 stop:2399 length:972 start_codon:yes stop_codon:yes gene_type:complete
MPSPIFDRSNLKIKPLSHRVHDLNVSSILELDTPVFFKNKYNFKCVSENITQAKKEQKSIILMMGGHLIRSGVQKYIIDLMTRGYISCLSMNGSGIIHDFEFALIGETTESVSRYIQTGEFGLWRETGYLNDIINDAFQNNPHAGMGEAVGQALLNGDYPFKHLSILAIASKLKIPVTVHVGIGYDIIHEHPNCDGAATGALSYNDFLKYVEIVGNLEGGVVMNFGSAVMAPEVFLKALSMARNVARQDGKEIRRFTTLVCDLHDLPEDYRSEVSKKQSGYYFRPWKTMLVRTVSDGGQSFYVRGRHEQTFPTLWTTINSTEL